MRNNCVLLAILLISGCSTLSNSGSPSSAPMSSDTPKTSEKHDAKRYADEPEFSVPCEHEGNKFAVEFKSKSGKIENNDMSVALKFDETTSVPVKVEPAWYHRVDSMASFPSICDGVPAYLIDGTQQIMLILNVDQKVDGKPGDPETTLVLVDLKTKRVLNKLERVGRLKAADPAYYSVIPAPNGFQIRLLRDPKTRAEDWKWIIIKKASITSKWMSGSNKKSKVY